MSASRERTVMMIVWLFLGSSQLHNTSNRLDEIQYYYYFFFYFSLNIIYSHGFSDAST
jgi:hypothetical protein